MEANIFKISDAILKNIFIHHTHLPATPKVWNISRVIVVVS